MGGKLSQFGIARCRRSRRRAGLVLLLVTLLVAGCATPSGHSNDNRPGGFYGGIGGGTGW
jgi:predicted small secreted protein